MQHLNLNNEMEINADTSSNALPIPVLVREVPNISDFNASLEGLEEKIRELKMQNIQHGFITKVMAVLFAVESNQ
jgi:hypothetical protein